MITDLLSPDNGLLVWTLVPLAACSVIGLALILDRLVMAATTRRVPPALRRQVETRLNAGDVETAATLLAGSRPFFLSAIETVLNLRDAPKALRDEAASQALRDALRPLSRRRSGLVTLAALAPMLGLLGTVIGMMAAFQGLETHDGPVDPSIVAGGLWQAMITTAVGLTIAMPCILASAWLKSWTADRARQAGALLTRLSIAVELHDPERTAP
ncbi:MotA/TolQ/ExbB proton channel family protein [Maricaulis parjimensis]|uniref:MotA/TolQ/ExbB proton channel family protein n=1 Tax=Maricaulis parjimensis TaxID=144023 RepID=UPI00193A5930|nr:MotA/TolQ/ExbB proton channel family protein [Maricaulis parjimensis]